MVLIAINWLFLVSKYDNPLKYGSIFRVGRIPLPMVTNSSVMIRHFGTALVHVQVDEWPPFGKDLIVW